jgi:beta-lactamase regulating signal transducer with metallopeptidase domain
MSSSSALDAAWLQFVIASAILLMIGHLALKWVTQPVERIRVIQATLAAVLAIPLLLAAAPWPAWRLGLVVEPSAAVASEVPSAVFASGESVRPGGGVSAETELALRDTESRASGPAASPDLIADRAAAEPAKIPERAATGAAIRRSQPPLGFWTIVAASLVAVHSLATLFFLIEWGIGAARLRRLVRGAAAPSARVREAWETLTEGRGGRVQLLVSPSLETPLTFGLRRPVVALPGDLADGEPRALRYCLAHEWSHIERGDMLSWLGLGACQFLLWCQPLFWSLRREIRICQDILADDRATRAGRDSIEYSELLLGFATKRLTAPLAGALTFFDHPSQLTRRIKMLLQPSQSLRSHCRWKFSVGIALAALGSATLISGVRLDSARGGEAGKKPQAAIEKANTEKADAEAGKADTAQSKPEAAREKGPVDTQPAPLTYHCLVIEKGTGKGIPGAKVTVRRSLLTAQDNKILEESKHTTDAEGKYTVVIPSEQVAERYLYIELDVEHDEFAARKGFGYALSMILKNEPLGERPFFERTELQVAEAVRGTVVSPEGRPLEGIKISGFSMESPRDFNGASWANAVTAADGTFRLNFLKGGDGVLWVVPKEFAIVEKFVGKERGDLGEFRLPAGVRVGGQVLSAEGKPLPGVAVNIDWAGDRSGVGNLPVASSVRRGAISDADGRFTFDPVPAGDYRVIPEEHRSDPETRDRTVYPLPGVFLAKRVSLKEGGASPPLEIQAVPHVVFHAQILDSQGAKTRGHAFFLSGELDGEHWFGQGKPDTEGTVAMRVPHGLQKVRVQLSTNEHGALRYRRSPGAELQNETRNIDFGTMNDDVEGFEIVRYKAPIVLVQAVGENEQPVKEFKVTATYPWGKQEYVVAGEQRSDIHFEHQDDGRYRTSQMLPDEEVTFTVSAKGYEAATAKVKLAEGESKDLVLMLKKETAKDPAKEGTTPE